MNIKDATVLVTGANRGIGLAFVKELLAGGARKVYAGVRDPDAATALAGLDLSRVEVMALDVTKPDAIAAATAHCDDVALLVNNAGIARFAGLIGGGDAARDEMETNYFGTLNMIRAFAPVLKENGGGAVVTLGSIASHVNFPVLGSYSASKAAVHSLIQGVRAELADQGTLVVGVYPGPIDTEMAEPFPMEKTAPDVMVRTVLDALEAGEEDVYPDAKSVELHAGLQADPKAVEKEVGTMLPQ
ncbi:MAG TPA: SDR family NAD(P)-dependent oxidoreductase [Rhodospirillales bacterium]|nr:SDR family NAD(P)-dependent oxidoreductase [Rhodospirillales bacterium]